MVKHRSVHSLPRLNLYVGATQTVVSADGVERIKGVIEQIIVETTNTVEAVFVKVANEKRPHQVRHLRVA
jgi:endonuclease IV